MPAREEEEQIKTEVPQTDLAKEAEAAAELKQESKTEQELPIIASSHVGAETASTMAYEIPPAAARDVNYLDHGVHPWQEYKQACEAAGKQQKWQEKYRIGHTSAAAWINPHELRPYQNRNALAFDWELREHHSASRALDAWFAGPTVADHRSIAVALELKRLRQDLGDQRFDELCGSADHMTDDKIPASQRLRITAEAYNTDYVKKLRTVAIDNDVQRTAAIEAPVLAEQQLAEKKPPVDLELALGEEADDQIAAEHV